MRHCERCGTVVEPIVSQAVVREHEAAGRARHRAPCATATIRFVPERFTKVYLHWMENIRDWCITRQLWWGHRIPVWYCDNGHRFSSDVEPDDVTACPECGSTSIAAGPGRARHLVLLGPLAVQHARLAGRDAATYDYFYPTTVMETGYDILFFWVARMIMQGIENTGEVPFHTVYLHGLVRDEHGQQDEQVAGQRDRPAGWPPTSTAPTPCASP